MHPLEQLVFRFGLGLSYLRSEGRIFHHCLTDVLDGIPDQLCYATEGHARLQAQENF